MPLAVAGAFVVLAPDVVLPPLTVPSGDAVGAPDAVDPVALEPEGVEPDAAELDAVGAGDVGAALDDPPLQAPSSRHRALAVTAAARGPRMAVMGESLTYHEPLGQRTCRSSRNRTRRQPP